MIRKFAIAVAAIAAFALASQSAQAGGRHHHHHLDKRVTAVAIGAGVASTAAFFAINDWKWNGWSNGSGLTRLGAWGVTTIGCVVVSPIVATAVLKRPLSNREAGVLIGSCVIPIVGGWLVNAAYDAHPEWEPGYKPHRHHHHKHHKK
ncbi:MAG TPA: hypothetical protein VFC54_14860 [Pseudolabrys sp.]|nr:hypothetical protein [Pseudolabrys sp.]